MSADNGLLQAALDTYVEPETIELDHPRELTAVLDCDQLPGGWIALFSDPDEAERYADWRRDVEDMDGGVIMAATAMKAEWHARDGDVVVSFVNEESEVITGWEGKP